MGISVDWHDFYAHGDEAKKLRRGILLSIGSTKFDGDISSVAYVITTLMSHDEFVVGAEVGKTRIIKVVPLRYIRVKGVKVPVLDDYGDEI
jgi:hypothetical protein